MSLHLQVFRQGELKSANARAFPKGVSHSTFLLLQVSQADLKMNTCSICLKGLFARISTKREHPPDADAPLCPIFKFGFSSTSFERNLYRLIFASDFLTYSAKFFICRIKIQHSFG